jgi:hypothetical protein
MSTPQLPPSDGESIGGWSVEDVSQPDESPAPEPIPGDQPESTTEQEQPWTQRARLSDTTPRGPRRPRRAKPPIDRRLRPAGHALVIVAVALFLSLLLNAPGLHKTAQGQPDGWQRDVALDVTGVLDSVSGTLQLDEPRAAVKAIIGRSDDDTIDTSVKLPPTPTTNQPTTPTTPVKRAFTKKRQMRLWVAGDSLVVVPGQSIDRAAGASPVIEPVGGVDGRIATGLERPDVFNWFTYIPKRLRELEPDVVVLCFGGNDDHGYMTGLPKGVSIDGFATTSWQKEYGRRVGGLMDAITRSGAFVVWIGLPITRDDAQTLRFDTINAVVAAQARKRPHKVAYVDTYTTFASDTGGYTEYLSQPDGSLIKVRAQDGVHFERNGGDMIAREVLRRLNQEFDLTSWRKKAKAAQA